MAITQALCNSYKLEQLSGIHDFNTDEFRLALYRPDATLNATTTAYTTTGETSGTGYTAGGLTIPDVTLSLIGSVAVVDFGNVTWTSTTISARGGLIYNASKANRAVAVVDFGATFVTSGGNFTANMPEGDAQNAIIRIP